MTKRKIFTEPSLFEGPKFMHKSPKKKPKTGDDIQRYHENDPVEIFLACASLSAVAAVYFFLPEEKEPNLNPVKQESHLAGMYSYASNGNVSLLEFDQGLRGSVPLDPKGDEIVCINGRPVGVLCTKKDFE